MCRSTYARLARLRARTAAGWCWTPQGRAGRRAAEGAYLFKPSLRELRELTGQPWTTELQWREAAQQIIRAGQGRWRCLWAKALLVTCRPGLRARSAGDGQSSIGAGDSFVAAWYGR